MTLRFVLLSLIIFTVVPTICGQSLKIGFTNPAYILSRIPEKGRIDSEIASLEKRGQNALLNMEADLSQRMADYKRKRSALPQAVRVDKEKELQKLADSIAEFRASIPVSVQKRRNELLAPLLNRISVAIQKTAEEKSYDYIFNVGVPGVDILLFAKGQEHSITDQVLIKLGIKP